jgi:hypothetical protein
VQPGMVELGSRGDGTGGWPGDWTRTGGPHRAPGMPGLRQQGSPLAGPARLRVLESHPRSVAVGRTPLRFLIGKTGQTAQVPPIDAGRVCPVSTDQIAADGRRHCGLQGGGAHAYPGLPVSGTALDYYTGFMPVAPHAFQHRRLGGVQVDQDIAGVLALSLRPRSAFIRRLAMA